MSPGGGGYLICIQNMKLITTKFKSGGLYEKHVVATWSLEKYLRFAFRHRETKKTQCYFKFIIIIIITFIRASNFFLLISHPEKLLIIEEVSLE